MPIGRPSDFTPDTANAICERIAKGESLRSICSDKDMPATTTVLRWLEAHEAFRIQYARAREKQADHYADEIVEIADKATDANLARLQIDARKWTAGKLRPKVYGDKVLNEHSGPGGGAVQVVISSTDSVVL